MRFSWSVEPAADCQKDCGWISAVGIITSETADAFDEFARGRDLTGATVVLDSGGGSVLDAIKLGRRWRDIGLLTTVGKTVTLSDAKTDAKSARINPQAYCESMCVFLLLSGAKRYVPPEAHVRVHQIWMGDRADDAKAATYSAQDLMIVQRDVGRLTKYTFEMGGSGDLLALALSVPPWEPLRELSPSELRLGKVTNVDALSDVLTLPETLLMSLAQEKQNEKPIQDRFAASDTDRAVVTPTKTAEAGLHARLDNP